MYLLGAFIVLAGLMIIGACCPLLSGKCIWTDRPFLLIILVG